MQTSLRCGGYAPLLALPSTPALPRYFCQLTYWVEITFCCLFTTSCSSGHVVHKVGRIVSGGSAASCLYKHTAHSSYDVCINDERFVHVSQIICYHFSTSANTLSLAITLLCSSDSENTVDHQLAAGHILQRPLVQRDA